MVGDWVYNTHNRQYEQVGEIGSGLIMLAYNDLYDYDEIEPIPLTPEILEKIGFETQPNIGYIIDDWDGTQIIYDSWNHNLRIIKNYKICLDVETFDDIAVHELQHALKLCEIEREIKL